MVKSTAVRSRNLDLQQSRQYVAPDTETQKKLVQIWSEVLGLEKVGINENFFLIGGDSIRAIKLVAL